MKNNAQEKHNKENELWVEETKLRIEESKLRIEENKKRMFYDLIEQARRNVEALGRLMHLQSVEEETAKAILKNIKIMNKVTE